MDFMGVVNDDLEVCKKIVACKKLGKKVDGHAPGLRGEALRKYAAAGVSADHECATLEEALEKLALGMMIQIREGSAAKDFDALYTLIDSHPDKVMLCTDDAHPDELMNQGHINELIRRGLRKGLDLFNLLRAASYNAIHHYGLDLGMLQVGDAADFIVVDSPGLFNVQEAYRKGICLYANGEVLFESHNNIILNNFSRKPVALEDIQVKAEPGDLRTILVCDGDLITGEALLPPRVEDGFVVPDPERDLLKIVIMSRYDNGKPIVGFVKGFGFTGGAIAESIAHDSHNIIAVGASDQELIHALNVLIDLKGGIVAVKGKESQYLKLDVAGLMSSLPASRVVLGFQDLKTFVAQLGSSFHAPFMTLAFLSLLVIPKLKLSDKGIFDVEKFRVVNLFQD
jgi:adenine deaminase